MIDKLLKEVALLPNPVLRYNTVFGVIYFLSGVTGVFAPQFMVSLIQLGASSQELGYVQAFGLAVSRLGIIYLSQGLLARSAFFVATSIVHRLFLYIPILLTTAIYGWLSWPPVLLLVSLDLAGITGLVVYHVFYRDGFLSGVKPECLVPLINDRPFNIVFVGSGLANVISGILTGFQIMGANAELITGLPSGECTNSIRALVALTCGLDLVVGYHDLVLSASHADSRTNFVTISIVCRLLINPLLLWLAVAGGVTYRFAAVVATPEVIFGAMALRFSLLPDGPLTHLD